MHNLYQPTGLNHLFNGDGLTFDDYIQQSQHIIAQTHTDVNPYQGLDTIQANSPFCLRPPTDVAVNGKDKYRKGILLIHGLFDSPFWMRDIGAQLQAQGYLVYAILLPGHGSVPGDLLNIHHQQWLKAVNYGLARLQQAADNIYLGGFSLGSALALYSAQRNPAVKGLVLFSPALRAKHITAHLAGLHNLLGRVSSAANWLVKRPYYNPTKYSSFAYNAISQAVSLMAKVPAKPPASFTTPLLMFCSADDEVLNTKAAVNFFHHQAQPKSKFIYYAKAPKTFTDPRITVRNNSFSSENIVDFSHICLPIMPSNPLLGREGDFRDFLHYKRNTPPSTDKIYQGAISKKNLQHFTMQRLNYNPDFDYVRQTMIDFLTSC